MTQHREEAMRGGVCSGGAYSFKTDLFYDVKLIKKPAKTQLI